MDTSKGQLTALFNEWESAFSLAHGPEDDSLSTVSDISLQTLEAMLNWYCAGGKKQASRAVRAFVFCIFYNILIRERIRRGLSPPAIP